VRKKGRARKAAFFTRPHYRKEQAFQNQKGNDAMAVRVRQRADRPGWWLFIDHEGKQKKKHFPDKETAFKVARKIRERLALGDFGIIFGTIRRATRGETLQRLL
jgi:hypothetical protein